MNKVLKELLISIVAIILLIVIITTSFVGYNAFLYKTLTSLEKTTEVSLPDERKSGTWQMSIEDYEQLMNSGIRVTDVSSMSGAQLIRNACSLLGGNYRMAGGDKGVIGNAWDINSAVIYKLPDEVKSYGIDCSGLIYWALGSMGAKTTGFEFNHPVPVDTNHWVKDASHAVVTTSSNLTINGKALRVLKANDTLSASNKYWQLGSATIPEGSIVISEGNSDKGKNHAWIYLGEYASKEELLSGMYTKYGVSVNESNVVVQGNSTHWRLEAAGGIGVKITNIDPETGGQEANGKSSGKIWVFEMPAEDLPHTYESEGRYGFELIKTNKKDDTSEEEGLTGASFIVDRNIYISNEKCYWEQILDGVKSDNPTVLSGSFKIAKEMDCDNGGQEIIEIQEIGSPDNYTIMNKKIAIQVKFQRFQIDENNTVIAPVSLKSIKVPTSKQVVPADFESAEAIELVKSTDFIDAGAISNSQSYIDPNNDYSITVRKERADGTAGAPTISVSVTVKDPELPIVDLALKKNITKVISNSGTENEEVRVLNDKSNPDTDVRSWSVNTESLATSTNATYSMNKTPVIVKKGDLVEYSIKVFNEGEKAAKATIVNDYLPKGMKLVSAKYNGNEISQVSEAGKNWCQYMENIGLVSIYGYENDYIPAYDSATGEISYDEILITCIVEEEATGLLTNISEIYSYEDSDGNVASDIDSTGNNWKLPSYGITYEKYDDTKDSDEWRNYKTGAEGHADDGKWHDDFLANDMSKFDTENNPLQGDDDDFDRVLVEEDKEFDLALRKFITKVNGNDLKVSREPQVDVTKLASGESTTAEYKHPKDPVLVTTKDIVEYSIRVFNEGEVDGYASLVMDDIPDGVQMIAPDYTADGKANNLNAEYRWVMYRQVRDGETVDEINTITYDNKKYVVVDNPEEAEVIVTDYLSMEQGNLNMTAEDTENPNLLKAFNPEKGEMAPDNYRDLKVEFKVTEKKPDVLVTNHAQITEDTDSSGKEVEDRDSTPNVWIENEDDQDYDVIKVGIFDLALYKWVTDTIVTEDGKTTDYSSLHTQDDKTNVVNVSIAKEKLKDVNVKFKYQVKVKNEGTIDGIALELKDHIPEGLKFIPEDNTEFGWVAVDDRTVTTDYLKGTVLAPGETAEVTIILTWINSSENLGAKINYAEISKDYNDFGWLDIDSTPNNFKDTPKEDDEDMDVVRLNIKTGVDNAIYMFVAISAMSIVAGGIVAVKRFVL